MESHHGGRRSHIVEKGGVTVSCDEEGRMDVGWHATEPPATATIEEEGTSKVMPPCMGERERVVAAALNLGEMEMNGRERLYAREKERVPWEKRKSVMDAAAQHVWEKRKMDPHVCEKTHNPCDTFSSS
jgi:hypothetical protein